MKLFSFSSSERNSSTSQPGSTSTSKGRSLGQDQQGAVIHNCPCCDTYVKFPEYVKKYKCAICQTTVTLSTDDHEGTTTKASLNLNEIKHIIKECQDQATTQHLSYHVAYKPLEEYLIQAFSSIEVLNNSFFTKRDNSKSSRYSSINYGETDTAFALITSLPTVRPYCKLLLAANDLLRKPPIELNSSIDVRWLLILLELPTLIDCLYHEKKVVASAKTAYSSPEIKTLSYEIMKRLTGYLAHLGGNKPDYLTRCFSALTKERFNFKVQLINLYITFHLTRLINKAFAQKTPYNDSKHSRGSSHIAESPTYTEYNQSEKLNSALSSPKVVSPTSTLSGPVSNFLSRNPLVQLPRGIQGGFSSWSEWALSPTTNRDLKAIDLKINVSHYGNEWHIKSAARLLSVFFIANKHKIPIYNFYNSLADYIQLTQDFEVWQSSFHPNTQDSDKLFYDIIKSGGLYTSAYNNNKGSLTTFCQFPFLLSLGAKVSILEYQARRIMERKAEEAFITAIDKKMVIDVNLRIQVRRSHITNDSLRCIKNHQGDLKKALKIEFIGEPGIDAGGIKKEWFQLLTRSLFSQENGMFHYNEESHLCWFAPLPLERNDELYYMVGVVLGLAIYNSTILDLHFPLALYKKLLGKKVTLDDYTELFPTTGKNLSNLLRLKDVSSLEVYFDTTIKDSFGNLVVKELIPGGSNILVTNENRRSYVHKWVDFYLNKIIEPQFISFYNGFHNVIGGNALSLFAPKEVEMIICGNDETKIDTESLKSITTYVGWPNQEIAKSSAVSKWFWEWFTVLTYEEQKKFLSFVTGSDRIPATGISTMSFKITRLQSSLAVKKLPVAHTCFNELCIYDYDTKEEMITKLNMSIHESEGFGLR